MLCARLLHYRDGDGSSVADNLHMVTQMTSSGISAGMVEDGAFSLALMTKCPSTHVLSTKTATTTTNDFVTFRDGGCDSLTKKVCVGRPLTPISFHQRMFVFEKTRSGKKER